MIIIFIYIINELFFAKLNASLFFLPFLFPTFCNYFERLLLRAVITVMFFVDEVMQQNESTLRI